MPLHVELLKKLEGMDALESVSFKPFSLHDPN